MSSSQRRTILVVALIVGSWILFFIFSGGKSHEYSDLIGVTRGEVVERFGEPQRIIRGDGGRVTLVYARPNTARRERHVDYLYIHLDARGLVTGID